MSSQFYGVFQKDSHYSCLVNISVMARNAELQFSILLRPLLNIPNGFNSRQTGIKMCILKSQLHVSNTAT